MKRFQSARGIQKVKRIISGLAVASVLAIGATGAHAFGISIGDVSVGGLSVPVGATLGQAAVPGAIGVAPAVATMEGAQSTGAVSVRGVTVLPSGEIIIKS